MVDSGEVPMFGKSKYNEERMKANCFIEKTKTKKLRGSAERVPKEVGNTNVINLILHLLYTNHTFESYNNFLPTFTLIYNLCVEARKCMWV